jgi:hypothetical protein
VSLRPGVDGEPIGEERAAEGYRTMRMFVHKRMLEYRNDGNWCDVHPVLIPLLTREEVTDVSHEAENG